MSMRYLRRVLMIIVDEGCIYLTAGITHLMPILSARKLLEAHLSKILMEYWFTSDILCKAIINTLHLSKCQKKPSFLKCYWVALKMQYYSNSKTFYTLVSVCISLKFLMIGVILAYSKEDIMLVADPSSGFPTHLTFGKSKRGTWLGWSSPL